jgi:hypothetical protein
VGSRSSEPAQETERFFGQQAEDICAGLGSDSGVHAVRVCDDGHGREVLLSPASRSGRTNAAGCEWHPLTRHAIAGYSRRLPADVTTVEAAFEDAPYRRRSQCDQGSSCP